MYVETLTGVLFGSSDLLGNIFVLFVFHLRPSPDYYYYYYYYRSPRYNVSVCTNGHVAATLKRPKISEQQEAMNLIKPFLGNRSSSTWLRFVNQHLFCNGSKVTYTPNKKTLAKTLTDLVQRKELERLLRKPHLYWYVLEFCGLVFVLCLTVSCAVQIAKGWPEQWDETTLPYNIWKSMSHRLS